MKTAKLLRNFARSTGLLLGSAALLMAGWFFVVSLPDFRGDYLEVLGIDVFTNAPFRTFDPSNFEAGGFNIERWLGPPGSIAVSEEFVRLHHLKQDDKIRVRVGGIDRELQIGFLLRSNDSFDPHFAAMEASLRKFVEGLP